MVSELEKQMAVALRSLARHVADNTCQHEQTHRGGAIWEICSECGCKWADDEGGRPMVTDPPELIIAQIALAAYDQKAQEQRHEQY